MGVTADSSCRSALHTSADGGFYAVPCFSVGWPGWELTLRLVMSRLDLEALPPRLQISFAGR